MVTKARWFVLWVVLCTVGAVATEPHAAGESVSAGFAPLYAGLGSVVAMAFLSFMFPFKGRSRPPVLGERSDVLRHSALELPGARVASYQLTGVVGQGGMSTVYRAVPADTKDERQSVAIKVMQADNVEDAEFVERFRREMQISSQLLHPNIVRVLEHGETGTVRYIVMEMLNGVSLRERLAGGAMETAEVVDLMRPILGAVLYANSRRVIHRDLKPENVLLTDRGVKVMDFGLARRLEGLSMTVKGTLLGTPAYMSPEQITNQPIDRRTDQYSLGVVMYEMLTGRTPFQDPNMATVLSRHLMAPAPPLRNLRPDASPELSAIVHRMLEKDRTRRFTSLAHVLAALERVPEASRPQRAADADEAGGAVNAGAVLGPATVV